MNWNNISFVICKPDAVYLNLEAEILSFLRQKGLQILACKYVTITPDLCRRLYWDEGKLFSKEWWEFESEYFNLGESLCVLVQGTPLPPYNSISEMLDKKLKGSNRPENARRETIRGSFGSMNRIFNLFHSSDSTEAAMREASLFFSAENMERLAFQDSQCLLKQKEQKSLDISDLYFRIKKQCLQAASMHSKVKRKYKNYINEMESQSKSVSNSKKQVWLYQTLQEEYRKFYEDIQENELLKTITDTKRFHKINFDALFKEFLDMGMKLTKWEICLLKTTMSFPPKNF